jgi:hypothetical protein
MKLTPKVEAKHELLFNKPEAGLLNKCSCLAAVLGATKFKGVIVKNLVTLKSDLCVQQTSFSH